MIRKQRSWEIPAHTYQRNSNTNGKGLGGFGFEMKKWWLPETLQVEPVSPNLAKVVSEDILVVQFAASGILRIAYSKRRKQQPTGLVEIPVVLAKDGSVVDVGRPVSWKHGIARLVQSNEYHVYSLVFNLDTTRTIASSNTSIYSSSLPIYVSHPSQIRLEDNKELYIQERKKNTDDGSLGLSLDISISYGCSSKKGTRQSMEDTHIAEPCIRYWIKKQMNKKLRLHKGRDMVNVNANAQEPPIFKNIRNMNNDELLNLVIDKTKHIQMFCIFDGHRGKHASTIAKSVFAEEFCASVCEQVFNSGYFEVSRAIEDAMMTTEKIVLMRAEVEGWDSGTTAVICVVDRRHITVANVGDSRAVLSLDGKAKQMTKDHNLYNEMEAQRVEREGCCTMGGYLSNALSVTRALGDFDLKTGEKLRGLSALPYIEKRPITVGSSFIVLACDGLWDVLGIQAVVNFVRISLDRHGDPELASEEIVQQAMNRASTDNITAIVVLLHKNDVKNQMMRQRRNKKRPIINFSALSGEVQQILFQAAHNQVDS
mmetsp:Transcript_1307/g.1989  ORF Transcript_1307/g.1989 Transcript_1307/m.1989 type:complete len:540 (-) Transcript_1307:194-1813(-)|eukprot:CAMPEP_0204830274 /NCGR_PEP_ID=MMETSP1346-20131115/8433_1 /ASSEMBLY_ACC=CAM_ASM_000771 /TAXON_ID=215587 /ORGANISM="Aplanochytrium stocchinoi, Strain GSBS06" /LENGTH=539 /DNA_ID=CAMNT_0051960437 /DNA_START=348 /DNA_END=1967 /DNA_ORIENTATION=-